MFTFSNITICSHQQPNKKQQQKVSPKRSFNADKTQHSGIGTFRPQKHVLSSPKSPTISHFILFAKKKANQRHYLLASSKRTKQTRDLRVRADEQFPEAPSSRYPRGNKFRFYLYPARRPEMAFFHDMGRPKVVGNDNCFSFWEFRSFHRKSFYRWFYSQKYLKGMLAYLVIELNNLSYFVGSHFAQTVNFGERDILMAVTSKA